MSTRGATFASTDSSSSRQSTPTPGVTEYMRALAIILPPSKVAIMHAMPPIYITFLNRLDIEAVALTDDEIIAAIEASLGAQGRGQTVIEPRVHLAPGQSNGHFNVLRGAIAAPVDRAGIKVVGDFVDNYKLGYPSELGVVLLLDPRIGAPRAILDGAGITDMRTGAMT